MSRAILFSQMKPRTDEGDFHRWYDEEHVPARIVLPGFLAARRFAAVAGSDDFLAIYEADGRKAFMTPEYAALRQNPSPRTRRMLAAVDGFTRYLAEEISDTGPASDGAFLSINAFAVPPERAEAFDDWYESEHTPRLMEEPDWLRVRRYRIVEGTGGPWTHLALHELASREAMDSPARTHARSGPKRDALARENWFNASGRWLYRCINRAAAPASLSVAPAG